MNPPNTAQIVKMRLLDKVLPSESLLSLSLTLGILNLIHEIEKICRSFLDAIASVGLPMSVCQSHFQRA